MFSLSETCLRFKWDKHGKKKKKVSPYNAASRPIISLLCAFTLQTTDVKCQQLDQKGHKVIPANEGINNEVIIIILGNKWLS